MDGLLSIVEEPSAPEIEIDENRLREFLSRVKIWDFIKISQNEYQALSAAESFSLLKDYQIKMSQKYGSGKHSILLCLRKSLLFCLTIVWMFCYCLVYYFSSHTCEFWY